MSEEIGGSASAWQTDLIVLSAQAQALMRATLLVRALVLRALDQMYHCVRLERGRFIVLEAGVYRAG